MRRAMWLADMVGSVQLSPRVRKNEEVDFTPAIAPVTSITSTAEVAPSSITADAQVDSRGADRFRAELTAKEPRSMSGANGALRIGVGFGVGLAMPKSVADRLAKALDQFQLHPAKSFSELPGDVKNAVRDELGKHKPDSPVYKNIVQLATSDRFLQHSPAVQKAMIAGMGQFPKDLSFQKEMSTIAADPDFAALAETEKYALIKGFTANGADPAARRTICRMINSEAFKLVPDEQRLALIEHVAGTNYFGKHARQVVGKLLDAEAYQKMTPDKQAEILKAFVDGRHFSKEHVQPAEGRFDAQVEYSISEPKDAKKHEFYSGKADAQKYEVKIDGRSIPVYVAKKTDDGLVAMNIDDVAKAIASLPKEARRQIKSVGLEPHRDPDDKDNAKTSGDPDFRAFMAAGESGVVHIFPTPSSHDHTEIANSMTHETGHVISRKTWGTDSAKDKGWAPYRDAIAADGPPPSKYGGFTTGEDFAETWALYMEVKGTPLETEARKTFPARFAVIDKLVEENNTKAAKTKN